MKLKNMFSVWLLAGGLLAIAPACKQKPNDTEIKSKVETAIANPAVSVDVKEGAVTLSGTVADDATKASAETAAKSVQEAKSVTNAISVTPPPPPPAPVVIAADPALVSGLATVEKTFKGVKTEVKDGVVTLTGSVKRDELPKVMQAVMALRPKNVENKLTIK